MNCYCYYRTSSSANAESGTWDRQSETCRALANRKGFKIAGEFREVFTGTETDRPSLNDLLAQAVADGVSTIMVESSDRLSRELSVQMALVAKFKQLEINCIDASADRSLTESKDPVTEALTLIQGVFAQLEKKRLVSKLRRARDRASEIAGKRVEGRKGLIEDESLVKEIKKLRRKKPHKTRLSWNLVSQSLLEANFGDYNPEVLRRNFQKTHKKRKFQTTGVS